MPLPEPSPRRHLHTRNATYNGYIRDDGLWEIEAELRDTKTYAFDSHGRGLMPPGTPIHHMFLRVTLDDSFVIRDIEASMDAVPQNECPQAEAPVRNMIGVRMGPGWRKAIDTAMGGTRGCTHLRELLFNCATAAFQTIPAYKEFQRKERGEPPAERTMVPFHLGACMTWDFNSPATARYYPQFVGYKRAEKA